MKRAVRRPSSRRAPSRELAELRARLADAERTLRAIRSGDVDAVVVSGQRGARVFTLEGAETGYRVLIESMNEGALTLTADETILYANLSFARLINHPLTQVIGSSLLRFLSPKDGAALRRLLKRSGKNGSKTAVLLHAGGGSRVPAQISIRRLARNKFDGATTGVVVTDMTETRRNEETLRALARRVVEAQEAERGRVARELHDHITQLLCAIVFRSQALADRLMAGDGSLREEAMRLRGMLGDAADEVERISRNLRPGVLHEMGLVNALRATAAEFAKRTGVSLKLVFAKLTARLPADIELTLYRIHQSAWDNVEQHARARHVTERLSLQAAFIRLVIRDDGIGFDPGRPRARRVGRTDLGLLGMRERASYVGGTLEVKSTRRGGTKIEVRIPLSRGAAEVI